MLYVIFIITLFMASMLPGPNFMVIVSAAVISRQLAVWTVLGVSLGSLTWLALAGFGFGSIIQSHYYWYSAISIAGAIYLLYSGTQNIASYLNKSREKSTIKVTKNQNTTYVRAFLSGFLINITNPKSLFFIVSLITILPQESTESIYLVITLTISWCLATGWYLIVGLFVSGKASSTTLSRFQDNIFITLNFLLILFAVYILARQAFTAFSLFQGV